MNTRAILKRLEELGAVVEDKHRTGELRIKSPPDLDLRTIVCQHPSRRKAATKALKHFLKRMEEHHESQDPSQDPVHDHGQAEGRS